MSTVSTVLTIIICAVLVGAISFALVKGIWTASKAITVPIQIALFAVMLLCVVRLFCTKENAQKLYEGVEQTGIAQNVESTMRTALNLKPMEAPSPTPAAAETQPTPAPVPAPVPEVKPPVVAEVAPAEPAPQGAPAPVVEIAEVTLLPTPPPAAEIEPEEKTPDYSYLDKGKKTFTFALPFSAKVTVGFKDNTYRVISESLGKLSASEKKEIGKLILTSLGKYIGKEVKAKDKSKMSIESRYDEADGYSRVFAIIPPDAID